MVKKKAAASKKEVAPVLEQENLLVFKATRPLTDREFELVEKRLRDQEEKSGIKIVLVPHLVDLKEEEV